MVSPAIKFATTYAKDPRVVTAAGVVIVTTMNIWEDVLRYPKKEEDLDNDWLDGNDVLKRKADVCYEAFEKCQGTDEECDYELINCLQEFQDYH